jgi:hypothetical protein
MTMNKRRQRLSAICSTSINSEDIVVAEQEKEVPTRMFLLTRQSKKTAIEGLLLGRDSAWVELSVFNHAHHRVSGVAQPTAFR